MCPQPEFGQEATEEQMGEGVMDPEGQTYDDSQQVRTSSLNQCSLMKMKCGFTTVTIILLIIGNCAV